MDLCVQKIVEYIYSITDREIGYVMHFLVANHQSNIAGRAAISGVEER